MITKVLTYNSNQEIREIEVYNGANEYVESFQYYDNNKVYDVDLHDTYFDVLDKDRLVYRYCLIENESLDDYAKL